jgi:hypothetical protein
VADYNLKKDATLHLVLRLRGGGMQVFVKTLTGKTITLDVEPSHTVRRLKELVEDREDIPPERQLLISTGKLLFEDLKTLAEYGVDNECTVHLVRRLGRVELEGDSPWPWAPPGPF